MQRILTITTSTQILEENEYVEREYETLNKYLEEGYKVVSVTPVTPSSNVSYRYAVVFVLEKP